MNTTNLFIEILIIGYMGLPWLFMTLAIMFGLPNFQVLLDIINKAEFVIAIALTSFAYFLGILVDRIADSVLETWDNRVREKLIQGKEPSILSMQAVLFLKSPESVERFGYQQNRLRVVRAGIVNVGLFLLSSLIFIFTRIQDARLKVSCLGFLVIVVVIWGLTFFTYNRITWSYWKRTRREYLAAIGKEAKDIK
jgi:hypothetical protein